jgi:hypothetical protein
MKRTTAAGLALGIAAITALAVPLTRTALASDSQPATTSAQSSTSAQPAATSAQPAATSAQPLPSWTSTGTYTFGPGTIAPDGAPDYIGNSPAGCPAASGNQQQNGSQQGGNRNGRHHPGQQPAPSQASSPPGTGS